MSQSVSKRRAQFWKSLAFIAPNLATFGVFTLIPVIFGLGLAFFRWDPFSPAEFVGFDNFNRMLVDGDFWYYLSNTLVFMIGLPLSMAGSLFLALVLSQNIRGVLFHRTIVYLPSVTSGVALFLLWKIMYNKEAGLINTVLLPVIRFFQFGTPEDQLLTIKDMPDWLQDAWTVPMLAVAIITAAIGMWVCYALRERLGRATVPAMVGSLVGGLLIAIFGTSVYQYFYGDDQFFLSKSALIAMGFWASIGGGNMILYLAAIMGVPPELYEAARIDGASRWRQFVDITWPMIAPTTFFIFVMGTIGGLQGGFEMAFMMTGGGPEDSTTTIGYQIFTKAFFDYQFGYAAAISFVLFIIIMAITLINWRFGSQAKGY